MGQPNLSPIAGKSTRAPSHAVLYRRCPVTIVAINLTSLIYRITAAAATIITKAKSIYSSIPIS